MDTLPEKIYPVYILSRVASEIYKYCNKGIPKEVLGMLLGYRLSWQGIQYIKIVDWVSGSLENSHIHAKFQIDGLQQAETFIDERYLDQEKKPREVGLFHSHPFGCEPHFSSVDHETFLNFPYDKKGNVFILIDPLINYFKVFRIEQNQETHEKFLEQTSWIYYSHRRK